MPGVTTIVKRVIGLPGETIDARGGIVYLNGSPLKETYVLPGTPTDCVSFVSQCFPRGALAPDEYWVMGDNRPASRDSRYFGPVKRVNIVGVVIRIVSPPSAAGSVPGSTR